MTAAEIVATVKRAGGSVEAVGADGVRIHAPASVLSVALRAAVVEHKPELLRFLGAVEKAADVARSARLLRECLWPATASVCDFLIGHTGEACKRCGASWLEHYSPDRPTS